MNVGIIADNSKKKLLEDFCIAYRGILCKHSLYATATTGRIIEQSSNLPVYKFLAGDIGGKQQMEIFVEQSRMDLVIVFKDSALQPRNTEEDFSLFKACDQYSVPLATNLATAEMLIKSLDNGDLAWREMYRRDTV